MDAYRTALADTPLTFQTVTQGCSPAWHLCVVKLNENFSRAQPPVTESLANQILSLPFSHALDESTLNQIAAKIKSVVAQLK